MSISLDDVALSFKDIGISSLVPPEPIISNVSGYVVRGGITAGDLILFITVVLHIILLCIAI